LPLLILAIVATAALAVLSLFVGVSDVSILGLLSTDPQDRPMQVLLISRIPRTLAIILSGSALAIAGLVMQMVIRNRFVEPSTAGTTESASLGFLVATVFVPGWPLMGKMVISAGFALAGTALFLRILRAVPLRDAMLVPLVGIMLGGIIGAVTSFFAYRLELLPSLLAWTMGDFSGILRGRYELLWIGLVCGILAYIAADRFTVAGMGKDFTTNLGHGARPRHRFGGQRRGLGDRRLHSLSRAHHSQPRQPHGGRQHAPNRALGGGDGRGVRAGLRHHRPHRALSL
jgi:iron complex transport system permease protein